MIVYKISKPNDGYGWHTQHRTLDNKYVLLPARRTPFNTVSNPGWHSARLRSAWLTRLPWRCQDLHALMNIVGEDKVYQIPTPEFR